jgi:hypothetical protein
VIVAWLTVYVPAYAAAYGLANFLFLCNLSVLLVCLGVWRGSALLVSSQAVGELLVSSVWTLDVVTRFVAGRHLIGGTEYMWDARWPLFTRLLSLHHVAFPIFALWTLRRLGYDRRGILLQSAIAAVAVSLGRLFGPEANVNSAFTDPIFHRSWGPAPVHIAVVAGGLILVVYPLTHLLLSRAFRTVDAPTPSS